MIRTLPNGRTEHTPMTGEAYASAHDLMIAIVDSARRHGIEAVDLTNAALAAAAAKFDRGGWAALVETADQIADRKCRGAVACPACRAERFARTIDEIEQAAATPPPSN